MSLSTSKPQSPTSSLPPLRSLDGLTEEAVLSALRNLYALYCPLSSALTFLGQKSKSIPLSEASTAQVDSGYVSGNDDDDGDEEDALAALRADAFERSHATRWLTGFIARAEGLSVWSSEDACESAVEQASCVLAAFSSASEEDRDDEDAGLTREFSFELGSSSTCASGRVSEKVEVSLLDKPIGTKTDHTDVGLQSWGASIVFSDLICANPERFGLTALGPCPRVFELGAGTGLVGLTLAKLLPRVQSPDAKVVATDYHPAVLANLRDNVAANIPGTESSSMETCLLDWSAPTFEAPLDKPADLIVATDVVYAPEHAIWLRDCVARYLSSRGIFWLMATVRQNGKFEGISDTVASAFADVGDLPRDAEGRVLRIVAEEHVEKRSGIGRGDESGYKLYRIGWVAT
ncbi:Protein-lysine N-methyltransferase EFM2-like protein 2 [Seiridium cupressi]